MFKRDFKINKQTISFIAFFIFVVLVYAVLFQYLMITYENKHYDFITAIYWVILFLTSLGSSDVIFMSDEGKFFSMIVALSGVVMVFALFFPLVVTPWLQKALIKELPSKIPVNFKDHIIICGYNEFVETLITELNEYRIPFMIIDDNEKNIKNLMSRKIKCVYGNPSDENVLLNSNISYSRMLISNKSDEENASIILTAKGLCDVSIISIVEDINKSIYLKYAGADKVISPKMLFGTYLGRKAIDPFTDHLAGNTKIFKDIYIAEIPIYPKSKLIGKRFIDADIRRRTGANVIGHWRNGHLSFDNKPNMIIKENSVFLAIGTEEQLENLKKLTK